MHFRNGLTRFGCGNIFASLGGGGMWSGWMEEGGEWESKGEEVGDFKKIFASRE